MAEAAAAPVANEGGAAPAAAAPAAPAVAAQAQPTSTVLGSEPAAVAPAAPAAEGDKPAPSGDKPAEAKPADVKAEAKPVPVDYTKLAVPEGMKLAESELKEVTAFAQSNNLSLEQAQALVTEAAKSAKSAVEQQQQRFDTMRATYAESLAKDKDWGGDKLQETQRLATQTAMRYFTPVLKDLLNRTGLGDNPDLIIAMAKIGKQISEDKVLTGKGAADAPRKDPASALFPKQA